MHGRVWKSKANEQKGVRLLSTLWYEIARRSGKKERPTIFGRGVSRLYLRGVKQMNKTISNINGATYYAILIVWEYVKMGLAWLVKQGVM